MVGMKILRNLIAPPDELFIRGKKSSVRFKSKPRITGRVCFDVSMGGSIEVGKNCYFMEGVIVATYGGNIVIGDDCSFNPYSIIYGHGNLTIEDYVRVAAHSVIIPANHVFDDPLVPIYRQGLSKKGIHVESDVWIGTGSKILDGVRIGKGTVVAAGSVVNKDVEPFCVVGGVPARILKMRT